MEEKDKSNLKIIEFKKEKEKVPKFVIETAEIMLAKAKEGKLKTIICHFDYQDDEESPLEGGTLFWNLSQNPMEVLGFLEVMKSVALDFVCSHIHEDNEEK